MTLTDEQILRLLDSMIEHQKKKVLSIARRLVPGITEEDVRNPHDFAELADSQQFNFEDGILAGYLSARIALLAELRTME
ncbi:MAG: hypothetical protein ACOX5R_04420 [bacterium]|jgi:hypothetical protein